MRGTGFHVTGMGKKTKASNHVGVTQVCRNDVHRPQTTVIPVTLRDVSLSNSSSFEIAP